MAGITPNRLGKRYATFTRKAANSDLSATHRRRPAFCQRAAHTHPAAVERDGAFSQSVESGDHHFTAEFCWGDTKTGTQGSERAELVSFLGRHRPCHGRRHGASRARSSRAPAVSSGAV